jgi:Fic family protein
MANRLEHIKKVHQTRTEKTKLKVLNATTGLMQNEYKKKNGTWNITKIAKELKMSINTVKKYI